MAQSDKLNIIVTEEALKDLKTAIDQVEKLEKFIKNAGTISGNDDYQKQLKAQATETKKLTDEIIKSEKVKKAQLETAKAQANASKAELLLTKAQTTANEAEAKAKSKKATAYDVLLAKQKEATAKLRGLVVESQKSENANKNFTSQIVKAQIAVNNLNGKLLEAEVASKKYAMGASSVATPVLLFVEAQKKATQATKELNAEKAKTNAQISKQMTGQMVESVNAIGKQSDAIRQLNNWYREQETVSKKLTTQLEKEKEARNKTISKQMTGSMVEQVKSIGVPSDSLNQLNAYYRELEKTTAQTKKLTDAENARFDKLNRQDLIANAKQIGKPSDELNQLNAYYRELEKTSLAEAKAKSTNDNLSRAYVQLTASREKAKNKLQDLIASQTASTTEIRKAQKEFDVLNKKVAEADKAVGRFSDANRHINGLARSVTHLMSAFGISTGIYLFVDVIKGIYETTKALQSLDLSLKMVSGSENEFAKNKVFLAEVSQKWGLEVKSLTETYTQFYTASKGLLSDKQIQETFEGISKAGSVMGLTLEKQQAAFYAIDQMMSKGTVTAEELKKQLGNAMPGAIKAAAMAYMELHPQLKTIQEAEKEMYIAMKKGALDSATYVPLIAKNFQKIYGIENINSVETLTSAQNRLQNSWTEYIRTLQFATSGNNLLVRSVNFLSENLSTIINVVSKGTIILGTYLGIVKTWNFVTGQSILISRAFTIAKQVLNLTSQQEAVLTQRQTALNVLETAARRGQTAATVEATVATRGLTLAMVMNPIGALVALIGTAVVAYQLLASSTDDATEAETRYQEALSRDRKTAKKFVSKLDVKENVLKEDKLLIEGKIAKKEKESDYLKGDNLKKHQKAIELLKEELLLIDKKLKKESGATVANKGVALAKAIELERKFLGEKAVLQRDNVDAIERELKLLKEKQKEGVSSKNAAILLMKKIEETENRLASAKNNVKSKDRQAVQQREVIDLLTPEVSTPRPIEEKVKTDGGGGGNAIRRERNILNYDATKSEYDLRIAILERQKAEQNDIITDDTKTFLEKLEARKKYHETSLILIQEEFKKEVELSDIKKKEDEEKVKLQQRNDLLEKNNKTMSSATFEKRDIEHRKNLKEIQDIHNAEFLKSDVDFNEKKRQLNLETFLFSRDILEKAVDVDREAQKETNDFTLESYKLRSEDARETLKMRQYYFDKMIELYIKELEAQRQIDLQKEPNNKEVINAKFDNAIKNLERLKTPLQKAGEEVNNFLNSISNDAITSGLNAIKIPSLGKFLNFDENGQTEFSKMMDLMNKDTTLFGERFAVTFKFIGDVAQETINAIIEASMRRFDRERELLKEQKNINLIFAGDSASAKERIEMVYEKKKKEIARKEAQAKKKQAMFNIAMDTAQAIVSIWAQVPKVDFGISAGLLTGIVGALGAAQLAMAASQKIPELYKGTDNASSGLALTQERGAEIITDRKGVVKDWGDNKGARLTMMSAGDKVFTAEKTKKMMFEAEYHNTLKNAGILPTNNNNSISKNDLRDVMVETLGGRPTLNMKFDKGGFGSYITRNGNITRQSEIRGTGKGIEI